MLKKVAFRFETRRDLPLGEMWISAGAFPAKRVEELVIVESYVEVLATGTRLNPPFWGM